MRPIILVLAGVLLAACVVQEPYRPPPASERPHPRLLSRGEAIRVAFDLCRDRGLAVDRVYQAELDADARWRVELRGPNGDRAKLLLDGETGHLLKGRFREGASAAAPPPSAPPEPPAEGAPPPPAPPSSPEWDD